MSLKNGYHPPKNNNNNNNVTFYANTDIPVYVTQDYRYFAGITLFRLCRLFRLCHCRGRMHGRYCHCCSIPGYLRRNWVKDGGCGNHRFLGNWVIRHYRMSVSVEVVVQDIRNLYYRQVPIMRVMLSSIS